jgi:hypothetical protein
VQVSHDCERLGASEGGTVIESGSGSRVVALTIHGGEVRELGKTDGSGIGSGCGEEGNSTVLDLSIVSGNITASSLSFGYGIGSGTGVFGNSCMNCHPVDILISPRGILFSSSHQRSGR